MRKTLISIDMIEEHICGACGNLHAEGALITPGARDELARRGIRIVYGGKERGEQCNGLASSFCAAASAASGASGAFRAQEGTVTTQDMLVGVAALIQRECGVTDPDQLRDMTLNVVKTLQKNLA